MDNTNTKIESAQQKEQFVSFLHYIKRKKRVVILITTLGILLGIAYSLIKKPVYTASLTFSLQEETKMSGGGLLSLASSFGLDMGSSSGIFSGDNIEQVFKSRKILEKTLFQPYPNTSKTYGDWFLQTSGLNTSIDNSDPVQISVSITNTRRRDSIIAVIHKYLSAGYLEIARPDKKYDIYQISYKGKDELFSKMFVQEIVNQVASFYTETKTKKAKQNVEILQKRVDSIHDALGDLITQKANIADANLNPIFQKVKVREQKGQIDMTALSAGYGELLKNLELAKYTLLKETPLIQIIDEPKLPLKKKTYSLVLYSILGGMVFFILSIGLLVFLKLYASLKQLLTS